MTDRPSDNMIGIGFILLSCLSVTVSAVLIRMIGKDLGSFEVVFIRCSFTLLFTLVLNVHLGTRLFTSPQPLLLGSRSLILSVIVLGNFYAIVHLPLVQVTAIQFTKPLFLVVLAALFLGERIRLPRTIATLLGFTGILVIIRPDGEIHLAQAAVLAAAVGMAVLAVLTKKLTPKHLSSTLILYGNLALVLVCLGPTILYWKTPTLAQLGLIAALGLSAYFGQFLMVQAYRFGETTVVTPFEYIRIIFIGLAGFIIFGEIPDHWTITGALIICGSTLFIAYREARKSARLRLHVKEEGSPPSE